MRQQDVKALDFWAKYRKNLASYTTTQVLSPSETNKHRIELEKDIIAWCKFFFPSYCSAPFAPFQERFLHRITSSLEYYQVLSWSRELSKSTITMFATLYLTLTGHKHNVLLSSSSYDNASRLLEPYRANLDSNQLLIQYYGVQHTQGSWEEGEFTTSSGVSFRALGAGQSPRGSRSEQYRPDIIICDDFDTDEDTRNPDTINKKFSWFEQALYATRSIDKPLTVIWCGNIIAKDCCITRAGKVADSWDVVNIRDSLGHSTWVKNSEQHIDRALSKISTRSAQQEYFNNPLSEGEVFKELFFEKIPPLSRFAFIINYGDPAFSNRRNKSASTKAISQIGFLNGKFYVIDMRCDRATNSQFVSWFYDLSSCVPSCVQVYNYIENNTLQDPFYQQVFLPLFRQQSLTCGVLNIQPDTRKKPDKFSRIEGALQPLNQRGALLFNADKKDNEHFVRTREQFLLLSPTLSSPADAPDCIEGNVWLTNQRLKVLSDNSIQIFRRQKNNKRI